MTPQVGEVFGFVAWKKMKQNKMIPQVIPPPNVYVFEIRQQGSV